MIRTENLTKVYGRGLGAVLALDRVTLSIDEGEMVAIMGPSGSGKSTLMNILGCLDRPTEGRYLLAGVDVASLGDEEMADIRGRRIGFIFQQYNLLPFLTALENVEVPLLYQGVGRKERRRRAAEALESLGLGARLGHKPSQLSGGEQQRVAVARALVTRPSVVLADEPTGNLPTFQGEELMALLKGLNAAGTTIVVVTHNEYVARHCRRIVRLRDGAVVGEEVLEERRTAGASEQVGSD